MLTLRQNGTGGGVVGASWWNDYFNLLTGAMNDQPVTLSYLPGSSTSTPPLALNTNANAPVFTASVNSTLILKLTNGGNLQDGSGNNYGILKGSGATAGRQIFVGTSTPTGANEGDLWVKV